MENGKKWFNRVIFLLSFLFLLGSFAITPPSELKLISPGAYPVLISCLCLMLSGMEAWRGTHGAGGSDGQKEHTEEKKVLNREVLTFIALMLLYLLAIRFLHYTIGTLLFIFCSILYLKKEGWKLSFLISFISTFMILLIFKHFFHVILP